MELNTIFFIGPQGSGKGTQARQLVERLGFFYWEMGAILRAMKNDDTELAEKVTGLINQGVLLPDELLLEVVASKLEAIKKDQGVLFDGIPRRLGQAEFLMDFLVKQGRTGFTTIFLNVPREVTLGRLLLRAEKEGRVDDTEEAINLRLDQYYNDTVPVLDYLKTKTDFIEIDGTPSIETVTESINAALGVT